MSVQDAISKARTSFNGAIEHLKSELGKLQVGRASSTLVEGLMVDVYGSAQPMKAVASISVPDPRTIQIQPWDKGNLGPIEKSVQSAGLGLNPVNDGVVVRISIPPLTEERRSELTKVVNKLGEEAKIGIRNARQDAHNHFKQLKNDNELTEDDVHSADKSLQKEVDKANEEIEKIIEAKNKDVMTV